MAQSVLDLIDVKFQDATNHTSVTSTDTIGVVMPYFWGESDKVTVYNRTSFYEMFPESLPVGVSNITDTDLFTGYAQIKAAFARGAGEVEIYRPSTGWGWQGITIATDGTVASKSTSTKYDETKAVSVAYKYAGYVPQSLVYGFDNVALDVAYANISDYTEGTMITITVKGKKGTEYTVIEKFEGAANPTAKIGGESIFLEDVVNGVSQFIDIRVTNNVSLTAAQISEHTPNAPIDCAAYSQPTLGDMYIGIDKGYDFFNDYESSICTLLINPIVSTGVKRGSGQSATPILPDFDARIKQIAEYRKNCMAIIGYPTNETYDKSSIQTYFANNTGNGSKFCIALQGREYISVFGQRFVLNCVGGFCGATVNIAKTVRINQIASGYVYGLYGGSLKESLLSGDVIDLMELGINSVYTSKRGNLIWGTRTMYSRQTSYFGKENVMRVTSMLLKNIFPIAVETLHTDAASNPITRASLSTMLNSIIDTYISNQDLHADSVADCSDSINTDYLTKGGTILNIILRLHYIGLVERVNIKIIATDTSVTAEFV